MFTVLKRRNRPSTPASRHADVTVSRDKILYSLLQRYPNEKASPARDLPWTTTYEVVVRVNVLQDGDSQRVTVVADI